MWIRSQNKEILMKVNKIEYIGEMGILGNDEGNDTFAILGKYSTEEKALKVLDMIQKEILKVNCVLSPINNGEVVRMLGYVESPKVFEMPQDSEVE